MSVNLDSWLAMSFGMQALRQVADREGAALLGALGVGAEPLPHQMATVERILTSTEIRHLIADEVGLGKTVQAMMIVNALRLADPAHRALVVAPEFLLEQWATEFSTRCNISPTVPQEEREDADYELSPVRLIRPATLLSPSFLSQAQADYDLLIVDEPQALTQEQRDALARTRFASVLLLTATPGFGNARMRRQILRLIEPDRTEPALLEDRSAETVILEDEQKARWNLLAGHDPATTWFSQAFGRRICRWTRQDWPEITPARVVSHIGVPSFNNEIELAKSATALLNRPIQDNGESNTMLTRAQKLHRLGEPAQEAMRELGAPYPEELGDTRLDALLDRLLEIWQDEPDAKVVVVVGDNPSIDRLASRLSRFFPEAGHIAQVRRSRSVTSETDAMTKAFNQLDGFRDGTSRLLLIGDWAEAGLNLHYGAHEIIFYSCPWSVRAVDQLIGRLDRLAKGAERHIRSRKRRREIGVSTITWQGAPEARVVEGLSRLGVFERPRAPVSEETERAIGDDLHACAASQGYSAALERLSSLAGEDVFGLSDPVVADANPMSRGRALDLYARQEDSAPPGALPSARPEKEGSRTAAETALDGWLQAMKATGTFRIAKREDAETPEIAGTLLWYPQTHARGDITRPISLPILDNASSRYPNYADGAVAYLHRRRHFATPPAVDIAPEHLPARCLRFLDHGNAFHGELCASLIEYGRNTLNGDALTEIAVAYPPGHPLAEFDTGPMLIGCALWQWRVPDPSQKIIETVLEGCTNVNDRREIPQQLKAGLAADARWWRRQSPARFSLAGLRLNVESGEWVEMTETESVSALDPRGEEKQAGRCFEASHSERNTIQMMRANGVRHLENLLPDGLPWPAPASLATRKDLIRAELEHSCRALSAMQSNFTKQDGRPQAIIDGLARRYDARIAATEKAANLRCLLLRGQGQMHWRMEREVRRLVIHRRLMFPE